MGAEQSSSRTGTAELPTSASTSKICYYEILAVDRRAGDDEIRKAYHKKALELHPDRNLNDTENATKKFAEVQTAYEILSDPQERAWYDSHRDAILSGDSDILGGAPSNEPKGGDTTAATIFSLMRRFNSSIPMTDDIGGFFGILNVFFDQLAMEEVAAAEWSNLDPLHYPAFGRADDDYESVAKPFYRLWSGFSTRKQFSWRDKYRLSDAPDRRIRRLMEKENRKLREDGIREFNDAVQSLVSFVRKRDPRYIPNTQSEAERQAILRSSVAAQAARSRVAHQEKLSEYSLPEWAQSRNDDDQVDEFSQSDEESEIEHFECVVCNKIFKSEKQFEAHEKSKKHIKAVQQLQRQMKQENADFELGFGEGSPTTKSPTQNQRAEKTQVPVSIPSPDAADTLWPRSVSPAAGGDLSENLSTEGTDDDEYAPRSTVEDRMLATQRGPKTALASKSTSEAESVTARIDDLTIGETQTRKIGKAKLKREKKAARRAAEANLPDPYACAVCGEIFTSRTKLFDHLKELRHAAPTPEMKGSKQKFARGSNGQLWHDKQV